MAKRFIDSGLFRKPLVRALEAPCKLLWIYIQCECDHAGFWQPEMEVAAARIGVKLTAEKALEKLTGLVEVMPGGEWWVVDFVPFQYGTLNPANRVHSAVLSLLGERKLLENGQLKKKVHTSPLEGAKEKEKDTEKDKVMEKDKEKGGVQGEVHVPTIWPSFEDWWRLYAKSSDRRKCENKWASIPQGARETMMEHTRVYVTVGRGKDKRYRRDPQTYLNNENWNDDALLIPSTNGDPREQTPGDKFAEVTRLILEREERENAHDTNGHADPDVGLD